MLIFVCAVVQTAQFVRFKTDFMNVIQKIKVIYRARRIKKIRDLRNYKEFVDFIEKIKSEQVLK